MFQQNDKEEEEDSEVCEIATRNSWENHPMPTQRNQIAFDRTFSEAEFAKIKSGHIPAEMEDRWFAFFEDGDLYFHRSWTGYCIFQVKLEKTNKGWRVKEAWVNQDESQYTSESLEKDIQMLGNVFEWSLGI